MPELDITQILSTGAGSGGVSREDADRIFGAAYDQLRRLADRQMRGERADHTLQPTALLNEVYLRLVDRSRMSWESRAHFFGIASRAMRQVLVDHARGRDAAKRGGGWERVALTDRTVFREDRELDAVEVDEAITRLAARSPRMATVVELRVLGGLTGQEIAHVLGVSRKTVVDDWRVAALWLRAELAGESPP